jgi:hypothetical protein
MHIFVLDILTISGLKIESSEKIHHILNWKTKLTNGKVNVIKRQK